MSPRTQERKRNGPAAAEAGHRGPEVRSDCWVRVDPAGPAGVVITSKVADLYGTSLRELLEAGVRGLGLEGAAVTVEDQGALPWVILARLEAAARAALPDLDARLEPPGPPVVRRPVRDRLRRSRLYLPGDTPKFMLNAARHRPDGLILDLEDSVAPARKAEARLLVRNALHCGEWGECELMVRINQLPAGLEDLAEILPESPEVILIPKVEDPGQVVEVERACASLLRGREVPPPLLMPIVESARGILQAFLIASASPQVVALTIGLEDYTADLGVERTVEGRESFWARAMLVTAARAADVQPIDTVFSDVEDLAGLEAAVREAKGLGFVGKGCIHPRQIPTIHDAFAPTSGEIEKATAIVAAYEQARVRGDGVVALGSKMIDPPVVERALRTVEAALRLDLLDPDWREQEPASPESASPSSEGGE
jgi:citrate lyase subunit beta/citryl-CoA lyase